MLYLKELREKAFALNLTNWEIFSAEFDWWNQGKHFIQNDVFSDSKTKLILGNKMTRKIHLWTIILLQLFSFEQLGQWSISNVTIIV